MVVPPVEPVIFQRRDAVEAFSQRGSRGSAALEVPLAGGCGIQQGPGFAFRGICLQKEFGVLAVDAGSEDAERLAIGAGNQKQRRALEPIADKGLPWDSVP